ncbi:HTH-type transcriptional activator IlvY [Pseudoalteromonas spongiae]|uniref:HTH-type transcriptional activator IlvY n=1 Tax=Pseudoalteromonas spongiae TaxID=298657 RepID=UPI000C2D02E0|nr:HTH-type transcriptional activator IlvY [Pseudoalteromonas spongiae]
MDIKRLQLFLVLAEQLHFAKASELANVSAPTLSRNIKQLEDEVGAILFNRNKRSVSLTKQGEAFVRYARATISEWQMFRASLNEAGEALSGEVKLFSSVTATYSFLYDLLKKVRLAHPHIEVKLNTGDPALAIERVMKGFEDMAIAARPDKLHDSLAFFSLGSSPLVFIAPNDDGPLGTVINDTISERVDIPWQKLPFIVPDQGLSRKRLADWWQKNGINPLIYSKVAGNEAAVSMVSLGFGVALIPKVVVDNSPIKDKVQILSMPDPVPAFDVGLVTKKAHLQQPIMNAIWLLLK